MTYASKKHWFSGEKGIIGLGLLLTIILTTAFYSLVVRPQATAYLLNDQTASGGIRSLWVIIKDLEQQICFILFFWALIIIVYRFYQIFSQRKAFQQEWVETEDGEKITPRQAVIYAKQLEADLNNYKENEKSLLPQVAGKALRRFHSTGSIQEASESVQEVTETESDRLESSLSLIRYLAWAIPSIGFVGTVRGIGIALKRADEAIQGNIEGVTQALGLAFNSTLIALLLSIILMYFVYGLQAYQEKFILGIKDYCRTKLIAEMKTPLAEGIPSKSSS